MSQWLTSIDPAFIWRSTHPSEHSLPCFLCGFGWKSELWKKHLPCSDLSFQKWSRLQDVVSTCGTKDKDNIPSISTKQRYRLQQTRSTLTDFLFHLDCNHPILDLQSVSCSNSNGTEGLVGIFQRYLNSQVSFSLTCDCFHSCVALSLHSHICFNFPLLRVQNVQCQIYNM